MKTRSIVVTILLLSAMPFVAMAQKSRAHRATEAKDPPSLENLLAKTTSRPDGSIAGLLSFKPEIPLGPLDVLRRYEDEMVLITRRFTAQMGSISQAALADQITRDDAEYAIREQYNVALMQYEVLSTLHDILEYDISREAARRSDRASQSDTAAVMQPSLHAQAQEQ